MVVAIAGAGGVLFIFHNYGRGLPEYRQLADYEPPVMTRVYGGDGRLLAEYATEKRIFVPIKAIQGNRLKCSWPCWAHKRVKKAILDCRARF
ncbi:MAG: hypothetical protein VCD66_04600 [Alphaproteobacteria bacterium]